MSGANRKPGRLPYATRVDADRPSALPFESVTIHCDTESAQLLRIAEPPSKSLNSHRWFVPTYRSTRLQRTT
jgi:hypothetical protein